MRLLYVPELVTSRPYLLLRFLPIFWVTLPQAIVIIKHPSVCQRFPPSCQSPSDNGATPLPTVFGASIRVLDVALRAHFPPSTMDSHLTRCPTCGDRPSRSPPMRCTFLSNKVANRSSLRIHHYALRSIALDIPQTMAASQSGTSSHQPPCAR